MVFSLDTIRSHIITITTPPPTHQPEVAAMIGLSVRKPTPGIARHNSGRSVTSAPDVKARSPTALRMATRWSDASNASNACCNATATPFEIALSFSGRLIRMIETSPFCSTVTTLIDAIPFLPTRMRHDGSRAACHHEPWLRGPLPDAAPPARGRQPRQLQLATAPADRPICPQDGPTHV